MKQIATHCVVIDHDGEINYTVSLRMCSSKIAAKQFCNDHINDAISSGIQGSNKWLTRFIAPMLETKHINLSNDIDVSCVPIPNLF